jgi:SAM-dependent methyltransferase
MWQANRGRIDPTWSLMLTDFSAGMIDVARAALGDRAEYAVVDVQELPFADGSFEVVLANHMLYHVPDRPRAFGEIRRVLASGGEFHAATNGKAHMRELRDLVGPGWSFNRHLEDFGLETGVAQLEAFFADVRVERFDDALAVTEVEPVLAYVRSSFAFPGGSLEHVRVGVEETLARDGVFRIQKAQGIIHGRKP